MNEEEFFRAYMRPREGIHASAKAMGRMAGERDIVGKDLNRIHNAKNTGTDFYLPTNESEYKPLRDQVLTERYGEGFVDMYDRYKPVGQGASSPGAPTAPGSPFWPRFPFFPATP